MEYLARDVSELFLAVSKETPAGRRVGVVIEYLFCLNIAVLTTAKLAQADDEKLNVEEKRMETPLWKRSVFEEGTVTVTEL